MTFLEVSGLILLMYCLIIGVIFLILLFFHFENKLANVIIRRKKLYGALLYYAKHKKEIDKIISDKNKETDANISEIKRELDVR